MLDDDLMKLLVDFGDCLHVTLDGGLMTLLVGFVDALEVTLDGVEELVILLVGSVRWRYMCCFSTTIVE